MKDFLIYFLDHMPTADQWIAFLFVNLFACVAARNTVLRRQRKVSAELIDELDQRTNEYWAMIQKQANRIE